MVAPSVTLPGPVRLTSTVSGVASSTSVVVTLLAGPTARFSKLPPVAPAMVTITVSPESAKASSSAATLKVAEVAPAGMVTVVTPLRSAALAEPL